MKCENCTSGQIISARRQQIKLLREDGQQHGIDMACAMSESGMRGVGPVVLRTCVEVNDIIPGKPQLVPRGCQDCLHREKRVHK